MEAHGISEALKLIIEQRGGSQGDLGRKLGVTQKWVSNVILGKRDPGITRTAGYLARVGWEVVIRRKGEESDPMKRREFHTKIIEVTGGTIAQKVAGVTFVSSTKVAPYQSHDYVTALADHVNKSRNEQGGAQLILTARRHVERIGIADLISGHDRKLQAAAAGLVRVQALTLYDADRLNHAEGVANNALALAQESADLEMQALVYRTLSQITTYAGAGDRAHHYAQQGLKISGIRDSSRAELQLRLMRSLAILPGQEKATLEAFAGIHDFDSGILGINGNLGVTLSDLGRHRSAIHAFAEQADQWAGVNPHYHAQCLTGEIMSLLHASMPEVAADQMLALARILPFVNSARMLKEVIGKTGILYASARWINVPGMRDARDQLRAVVVSPT